LVNIKIFFLFSALLIILTSIIVISEEEKIKQDIKNYEIISKPSIIFIMTDDLSENMLDIAVTNNLLPNLSEYIFENGTKFTNSFVTYPVCCPSRATALVGQYSHNHQVEGNAPRFIAKFNDTHTIATELQQYGYQTAFIGKYLNGYGQKGSLITEEYLPPGWDHWIATVMYPPEYKAMYKSKINENGDLKIILEKYTTYVEGEYFVDLINEMSVDENPFFIFYWPKVPHPSNYGLACKELGAKSIKPAHEYDLVLDGVSIPHSESFNEEDLSDKPHYVQKKKKLDQDDIDCSDNMMRDHVESLISIDDVFGNVVDALYNNNRIENTIFIFTSDNGYLMGEHRITGKNYPFEESIRVPLYISGISIPIQTIDKLVTNNDWAVTISDYAGLGPFEEADGFSLKSLIEDPSIQWRKQFLIEGGRETKWYFYEIRTEIDSFTRYVKNDTISYYDLVDDPHQLENKANIQDPLYETRIDSLDRIMEQLKQCSEQQCRSLEMEQINESNYTFGNNP